MRIVLPGETILLEGTLVQGKNAAVNSHTVSRVGFSFSEISDKDRDTLIKYLNDSAVRKFLAEYSTQYLTYFVKRLMKQRKRVERAERTGAFLPVVILNGDWKPTYGVIRNISTSGVLLLSRHMLEEGSGVRLQAVIGQELVPLEGTVTRISKCESDNFPENFAGIRLTKADPDELLHLIRVGKRIDSIR